MQTEFNKERKEHPTLSNETVKQIVTDHNKDEKDNEVTFAFKKLKNW